MLQGSKTVPHSEIICSMPKWPKKKRRWGGIVEEVEISPYMISTLIHVQLCCNILICGRGTILVILPSFICKCNKWMTPMVGFSASFMGGRKTERQVSPLANEGLSPSLCLTAIAMPLNGLVFREYHILYLKKQHFNIRFQNSSRPLLNQNGSVFFLIAICTQLLKLELFVLCNEDIWCTFCCTNSHYLNWVRVQIVLIHAPLMQRPTRALFK